MWRGRSSRACRARPIRAAEPLPVAAGFAYRKKEGRREYVRVRLVRDGDGRVVAQKHPREGAGVITSLTETDGLVELPEETTRVEPGDDRRLPALRHASC